ncbi:ABC transporter permease subunit [Micromonospora purpureochromogenes]|uniref:ABC transporter permease subunit n=1 Tax=Micromonospora purpureochromogenes TaxID=47872 RepID=UPI0033EF0D65
MGSTGRPHRRARPRRTRQRVRAGQPDARGALVRILRTQVLPGVLPAVTRHAMLRLPGAALAITSLGFVGLGAQPPTPEWGLVLAEAMPYVERAPWATLAPAAALALLGAFAITASASIGTGRIRRDRRSLGHRLKSMKADHRSDASSASSTDDHVTYDARSRRTGSGLRVG